jgi:hypothetical protein
MLKQLSLGLVLASSACTSGSDDIWMPQGGGGGKADGYTTIKGSDIPSAYVDANKYYIIKRQIGSLTSVGALDADETSLSKRVDGIIANLPADGAIQLAELVRMESPSIHSSLFPAEAAALPKLWKIMEAPDANDTLVGLKQNFGVVDSSLPPAAAVPPANLAIASLASALQEPAQRLENQYNSDGDASTVTLVDLASGIANPAAFTPAEAAAFPQIQAVFHAQAVAQATAQIDVSPGPGTFTYDGTIGPVAFHVAGATSFTEHRNVQSNTNSLQASITAHQMTTPTVTPPVGAQILVISEDSGYETWFGQGGFPSLAAGVYMFEVWQAGQRTFSTNASLPVLAINQTTDLSDKLDYTLMAHVAPLARNIVSATATYAGGYYTYDVQYSYDTTASAPPSNASQDALTRTTSPTITLPVGRYSFPAQNLVFYVYTNNVAWVSVNGSLARLRPMGNYQGAPYLLQTSNGASFNAATNSLYAAGITRTLDASMRDI